MDFNAMFNQMNGQAPQQDNSWTYIRDVPIPESDVSEGYTRGRHFEMGYEAQSLPCPYMNKLIQEFVNALHERCKREGLFVQVRRERDGILCVIEREHYKITSTGYSCSWQYLGKEN